NWADVRQLQGGKRWITGIGGTDCRPGSRLNPETSGCDGTQVSVQIDHSHSQSLCENLLLPFRIQPTAKGYRALVIPLVRRSRDRLQQNGNGYLDGSTILV